MITKEEIQHLAKLARLKLTNEEIKKYQGQISEILDYVGQLKKVDTTKVEPCTGGTELKNVVREDVAEEPDKNRRERILKQAPLREGDFIKTRGVFEK
jgi:aspartyl-tRNA(Asn)/glutamyl-tRNA(Gln) amidotransferase subunit C